MSGPNTARTAPPSRVFATRYTLRNGTAGDLDVIASDSCAAVIAVHEQFGEQLARVAVKPQEHKQ